MKFLISLFCFFSIEAHAYLVHISFKGNQVELAESVASIFNQSYSVPRDLMAIHHSHDCREKFKSGLQFCLENNGQLSLTDTSNLELTKKSILSFSENRGENNDN